VVVPYFHTSPLAPLYGPAVSLVAMYSTWFTGSTTPLWARYPVGWPAIRSHEVPPSVDR
jgi:hypothetical protein